MKKEKEFSQINLFNGSHIIKTFLKDYFLRLLVIEGMLILSALFIYFTVAPFGKVFNLLFVGVSCLSTIALFLITFRFFNKFEKTELAKKDKKNKICFFVFFASIFFVGIVFTISFLIVKAITPSSKFLIQGIQYIVETICLFLIFGLGVYLRKVLNSLHEKDKDNLDI